MDDEKEQQDARRPADRGRSDPSASDRLIEALERLRFAEERRLEAPHASEEFHAWSRDVERHAREVFRLADAEGWQDESAAVESDVGSVPPKWPASDVDEAPCS